MKIILKFYIILLCGFFILSPLTVFAALTAEQRAACCCVCSDWNSSGVSTGGESCKNNIAPNECKSSSSSPGTGGASGTNCQIVNYAACLATPTQTSYQQFVDPSQFTPVLQVAIGGVTPFTFQGVSCQEGQDCEIPWISEYISLIYQYIVGLAAILAAIVILIAGFLWLMSAGSPDRISQAKELIIGALSGLALALMSYFILNIINPELIMNRPIVIRVVSPILSEIADQKFGGGKPDAQGNKPSTAGECSQQRASGEQRPVQITSYCRPKREDYASEDIFLCDLAMQCTCPSGRDTGKICNPGGRSWAPCKPFNLDTTQYCNHTASGQPPRSSLVAADTTCYAMGSQVCIDGRTYTVGDRGGWIKGDHFDLWNEDCNVARTVNSTVTASAGACP